MKDKKVTPIAPEAEEITSEEWNMIFAHLRSAPLANMDHAARIDGLLVKLGKHAFPEPPAP